MDNLRRKLAQAPVTTIITAEWSLLYSLEERESELHHLATDPFQLNNVIGDRTSIARDVHRNLGKFMRDTNLPEPLLAPRQTLLI